MVLSLDDGFQILYQINEKGYKNKISKTMYVLEILKINLVY